MTVVRLPLSIEVIVSLPILSTVTLGDCGVGAVDAALLADAGLAPAELLGFVPVVVLFAVVLAGLVSGVVVLAGVVPGVVVLAGVVSAAVVLAGAVPGAVVLAGAVPGAVVLAGVVLAGVAVAVPVVGPLSVLTLTTGFRPGFSVMTVVCVPSSIEMTISLPRICRFTFGDCGVGGEEAESAADDWSALFGGGDGSAPAVPAGAAASFAWGPDCACADCGRSLRASARWVSACRG
jgi:hypothetical protein